MGLMYLCSYVMIGHYFEKWRAFATGFSSCGSGVGTFVFAPLSSYLIEKFGWRGALLLLAGVILQGCVIGMTFRSVPDDFSTNDETSKSNNGNKKTVDFTLLLDIIFMIFCFSSFLCSIGNRILIFLSIFILILILLFQSSFKIFFNFQQK